MSLELIDQTADDTTHIYKQTKKPHYIIPNSLTLKPSKTPTGKLSKDPPSPLLPPPPPPLNQFLITAKSLGFCFPRKACVQLNRLCSDVGRFASNMFKMGITYSKLSECGLIQSAKHVLQDCSIFRDPKPSMMFLARN